MRRQHSRRDRPARTMSLNSVIQSMTIIIGRNEGTRTNQARINQSINHHSVLLIISLPVCLQSPVIIMIIVTTACVVELQFKQCI